MNNALADFLTRITALRSQRLAASQRADEAIASYYALLEQLGIEHCNFGGWQIAHDGAAQYNAFNGTRLSDSFLEEYTAELVADDYVMRRADTLSEAVPVMHFDIGLGYIDQMRHFHEPAPRVMEECARYGIRDGFAIIGDTSLICSPDRPGEGRYFGFCFAGDPGTNSQVKRHLNIIEIATFALLDQIMPQVEAGIDGVCATLTSRERDVLAAIARGEMRKQIAFDRAIALPTVDMHIASIKRKLKAATLPEAVARAYRYAFL